MLGYDYYKLAEDKSYGVDRTATLIAEARKQNPNALLFDNGDTIQGTALSDYQALVAGAVHGHDRHLQADEAAGL